jgi:uncharacterized protein YcaQ
MPPNVVTTRRLTREEARRIAVRAQQLDAVRPPDLLAVARRLTFLQLDPTAVVAPSADLVAWSRVGNGYQPEHLSAALGSQRTMFEWRGQEPENAPVIVVVRPMSDLPIHLAAMDALRTSSGRVNEWLTANAGFQARVLDLLRERGPLASRAIPDTAEEQWQSSGWTHDRNVTQLLEFLASRGVVAVAGRDGKQRLWDLAERVYPADVQALPLEEARRVLNERRLRAHGVARPKWVGDAGVPVEIEGTKGIWRMDPDATAEGFEGRTALLSPFDRLFHDYDRKRAAELFEFEFTIEFYKPAAQRRWGYFVMPILHGDRLVGKVDVAADRKASRLMVHATHEDVELGRRERAAVDDELATLAAWLGLDSVVRA